MAQAETENEDGGGIQKPKACASSFKSSNMTANNRPDIDQWEPRQFEEYAPKVPVVTKMVTERYDQGLGKQMIFVSTGDVAIYALTKYLQSNGWEYWDYETKVSSVLRRKYGDSFSKEVQKDTWCNSGKNDAFVELNLPTGTEKKGFVVLNGEINEAYKVKVLVQLFNSKTNIDGSRINLIILNTKYSEGLSLMTTTAVHILEPPRSMALLSQITARAIRMCSHVGLVYPDSWKVDIFRYMITRDDVFKTIDPLSYAGKKSLSAKETSSSHIALRADKAFGGDVSLLADSEGGGQRKTSLSRKVSGGEESSPPQRTKKLSGIDYLQNKCSERRGELECNAKDYCWFDEDTMQCKLLGTESSIFKVAKIKGDELETFLTLLRIASIDCAVFKSMHDPTKPVSCHMPIDSTSPGTELSSNARVVYDLSVETLKNDYSTEDVSDCTMDKSQETCTASSKCTFHGNKCVPKCELLQSSSACTKEPMFGDEITYYKHKENTKKYILYGCVPNAIRLFNNIIPYRMKLDALTIFLNDRYLFDKLVNIDYLYPFNMFTYDTNGGEEIKTENTFPLKPLVYRSTFEVKSSKFYKDDNYYKYLISTKTNI